MAFTFGGKYRLEEEIGYGGCGTVFMGVHTVAGKEVAIKVEDAKQKHSMLKQESKIYKTLMGGPGVPWIMWSGKQGDYNVMVIDLLGPSLEDLFHVCNKHFTLKTVLLLADQLISLIEFIHSRDWVHRDIKPANFLMGSDAYTVPPSPSASRVNVIDFGFAKKYADPLTKTHIPFSRDENHGVGTPLFASINTHRGEECSRRDDLESLAYTLIYFLRGTLPWRKLKSSPTNTNTNTTASTAAPSTPKQVWDRILASKLLAESSTPSPLTAGLPEEFDIFYRYARGLEFGDLPDYRGCRTLFRRLALRKGIVYDGKFDWSVGGGHGGSGTVGRAAGGGGGRRRKGCEACEAKAAMLEASSGKRS
ncbi:kinase-like protein [Rickenella mellea]|uniref:Kinase-like protein n=1 Tax=Rickenella mellea TaxID=50990 RepID=A0A4Y7PZ59_9AGAM|nr:kinase-like protein [Rickenella mellea]